MRQVTYQMKFDVFGRKIIEVIRENNEWVAYYVGSNGLKRKAVEIQIPVDMKQLDLQEYLADLFHEWATFKNGEVRIL